VPFCPYIAFCWLQCPDPTIGIGAFPHEFLGCLRLVTLTVRAVGLSAAADSWPSADAASHRGRAASYRASSDGAIRGADRQRFLGRPASPRPPGTVAIPPASRSSSAGSARPSAAAAPPSKPPARTARAAA
jgi:hypothetical protein